MTRTSGRRSRMSGDEGFALLTVMGGMMTLSLVVMATLAYVVNSLPVTRATQDATAAVQAAQAGVDDYLARLTTCDAYWKAPCAGSAPNAALTGWAAVPSSAGTGTGPAEYHVDVLVTPDTNPGLIRLRSTGRVKDGSEPTRSLVVDLRKKSLLDYIYYTDKEASSPKLVTDRFGAARTYQLNAYGYKAARLIGISDAEAAKCARYWYSTPTTTARTDSPRETIQLTKNGVNWENYGTLERGCNINFASIDTIDGPAHTNDAMQIEGALFKGKTTTSWWRGVTPDPTGTAQFLGSGADPSGEAPVEGDRIELPPSNASLQDRTDPAKGGQDGCIYTGPTRIKLRADGKMEVTSPLTKRTNPGCTTKSPTAPAMTTPQTVNLPKNGVVYVQRSTSACTTHPLGYPIAGDLTTYDCAAGQVFIQGTLSGRLTVGSVNDITITGDILYKGGLTGSDALGLIANDFVEVYHPVKCTKKPPAGYSCPRPSDMGQVDDMQNIDVSLHDVEIHAAILSVNHSFTVQNFDKGPKLGTLKVRGGIYQAFRGPVGTGGAGSGTGYAKDYGFDKRLRSLPPPSFLDPASAPWGAAGYAEVARPDSLP